VAGVFVGVAGCDGSAPRRGAALPTGAGWLRLSLTRRSVSEELPAVPTGCGEHRSWVDLQILGGCAGSDNVLARRRLDRWFPAPTLWWCSRTLTYHLA